MSGIKFLNKKVVLFLVLTAIIFFQGICLIPPLDRDESRFSSASKNMLLTKDYIDIRLEGEPRYKKPVGIYWAQTLSNIVFGENPYDEIWVYRIPSFIGIILSIVLIFLVTKKYFNEKVSFLASFFLITSILLISEIHQAKSDGLLFLFINICNLILLKNIDPNVQKKTFSKIKIDAIIFWISLGLGTLIKGPIIILFVGLPLTLFSILKRKYFLLRLINNYLGYFLYLLIVVPWFILITMKSGSIFWYESVINDLLRKVGSGQESHGFFPGYYSLLLFIFFWPGSTFIIGWFRNIFKERKVFFKENDRVIFLFCWFLPSFILYELIPTKLPHYVLPTYPAISILLSLFVYRYWNSPENLLSKTAIFGFVIFPLLYIFTFVVSINLYAEFDHISYIIIAWLIIFLVFTLLQIFKKRIKLFLVCSLFFQLSVYLSLVHHLNPKMEKLWIASKINNIIENYQHSIDRVYHFGFNEPSLVFLISHKAIRMSPQSMIQIVKEESRDLFIITEKESNNFREYAKSNPSIKYLSSFEGFNYSQGKSVNFFVFEKK